MYSVQAARLAGVLVLAAAAGCNASKLTGTSSGMSQSAVNSFMQQVATAYSNGMQNAHPQLAPAAILRPAGNSFPTGTPPRILAQLVNVSVQQRTNCQTGGYINVTGSMTGSIDNNGTGVLQTQITETINSWSCIGGFTINGDPYLSASGTFSFLNGQLGTAASIMFSGGFAWSGNGSGNCQVAMTMLFNQNGSGHLSGTACGQGVNETF